MGYCTKCGTSNLAANKFCSNCGNKLATAKTSRKQQSFKAGRYTFIRLLGEGGFGKTFLVMDNSGKREMVIKHFSPNVPLTPEQRTKALKLFNREAEMMKHLNHPSIPKVYDFFSENGEFYIAQEFIDGKTLEEILEVDQTSGACNKTLSEDEVVDLLGQTLDIIQYLQSLKQPVYHRDIKPSNIMIDSNNLVYLIDYGAVKEAKRSLLLSQIVYHVI